MYYIYHIPGIKVGCTNDFERRFTDNKRTYNKDITQKLLLEVDDIDLADELENKYSIELGYGEIPYNKRYKQAYARGEYWKGRKKSKEHIQKIVDKQTGRESVLKGRKLSEKHINAFKEAWNKRDRSGTVLGKRWTLYVDKISGFSGAASEMAEFLNCGIPSVSIYSKKGSPVYRKDGSVIHIIKLKQ